MSDVVDAVFVVVSDVVDAVVGFDVGSVADFDAVVAVVDFDVVGKSVDVD